MIGRVLSYMIYLFISVNGLWFLLCQDSKGFFTTIGFGDKLIAVSRWSVALVMHFIHTLAS